MTNLAAAPEVAGTDLLERALTERLGQLQRLPAPSVHTSLLDALEAEDVRTRAIACIELWQLAKGLDELLREDTRFPGATQMFVRTDNGASNFTYQLGATLLREAAQRGSARAAIDWAVKVLATRVARGQIISPVWGISIEAPVELEGGMRLVPLSLVPPSPQLRWLQAQQVGLGNGLVASMLGLQDIDAALVLGRDIQDAVCERPEAPGAAGDEFARIDRLFADTTLALCLAGPRIVIPVSRWFTFEDPDLQAASGGGGRLSQLHEMLPRRLDVVAFDRELAQQVVRDFLALDIDGKPRKMIRVALVRLKQALARHNAGDAAVELSIALEVLCGDETPTEMTHKVTVRAVRFLGGEAAQRKRNYALIKKVYGIRSKLVHRGDEPAGTHRIGDTVLSTEALLAEAAALCAALVRRLLAAGAIPDWTEFDLL